MASKEPFSVKKRAKSFRHAFTGIRKVLVHEHNFRIQVAAAIVAVTAGILLEISRAEWALLILAISLVLVAEILNSALEALADFVHPEKHEVIGQVKDYGAAAVLLTSLGALALGALIFVPRIIRIISG